MITFRHWCCVDYVSVLKSYLGGNVIVQIAAFVFWCLNEISDHRVNVTLMRFPAAPNDNN